MTLDFATAQLLEQLAEAGGTPLHEGSVEEARAMSADLAAMLGPAPPMLRVDEHDLDRPDGTVPIRVLVPLERPAGVIVYYHGGGWVSGSIDESDTVARKLAERTSCTLVLPGYRLAPEHRYPVAVDDSYAALEWVAERLEELARPDAPLFVAGDGAGGSLAAVMALRARDRGGPADRRADPDLPGHRRRLRASVVQRSRKPAPAHPRRHGLVLGSVRSGCRAAPRGGRLAATRRRALRTSAGRRADRRTRRAP